MRDPVDTLQRPHARLRFINYLRNEVFQFNFYRVHMCYFIVVILIASVIFYGEGLANDPTQINGSRLRYIDALFLCCSAMTTTGLNPVNLGDLTGFQQATLVILMNIGAPIFVSTAVVLVRRYYFHKRLSDIVTYSRSGRKIAEDVERAETSSSAPSPQDSQLRDRTTSKPTFSPPSNKPKSSKPQAQHSHPPYQIHHHRTGFGSVPAPWEIRGVTNIVTYPFRKFLSGSYWKPEHYYLPFEPSLDPRGRFKSLNERQREQLGGVEYRALNLVLFLIIAYQLVWLSLGVLFLVPYSYTKNVIDTLHSAQPGNLNPGWWAYFSVVTSFANGGLNVLNSNFIPFSGNYFVLIVAGALTVAGNTQFPIFLRFIVWVWAKLTPKTSRVHHTLRFLLDHPRRCFIYLFPAKETWYLFAIQLTIDMTEWFLFEVLNLGLPVVQDLPTGARVFDGLFQSTGLRTSGAYVVTISSLAPGLLVAYIIIMYISSYPVVMALRQTNTYEERSIGLDKGGSSGGLGMHLRRQLAYDIWFQILAWFLISIIERGKIVNGNPGFDEFSILFEVVSAYGTVGLSTGVPYDQYSLSGAFQTGSKIVLLFVMVRGRHRGLPLAIDRSILLPGEDLMHEMDRHYNEWSEENLEKMEEEEETMIRRYEEESGVKGSTGEALQDPERKNIATGNSRLDRSSPESAHQRGENSRREEEDKSHFEIT